eukprot:TRINITY_DN1279_c1_g1_i1.p6 TRINITY_DN1279_c1_g1~~TRINITY_DN1279_c1_g1_i1.p6  ORF type:complete len:128 (-),score=0.11 TRINITY_DN1279_c1_g1_i1:868-1251(-)
MQVSQNRGLYSGICGKLFGSVGDITSQGYFPKTKRYKLFFGRIHVQRSRNLSLNIPQFVSGTHIPSLSPALCQNIVLYQICVLLDDGVRLKIIYMFSHIKTYLHQKNSLYYHRLNITHNIISQLYTD